MLFFSLDPPLTITSVLSSPFSPPCLRLPVSELPRAMLSLCHRSSVPAALALCCMAMLEVSAMGCISLSIGMAALLLPHRCESVWTRGDGVGHGLRRPGYKHGGTAAATQV